MSYSKLIHEYLDGELAEVQQDVLFGELARDPALRGEFNQQVKLHVVAQTDMLTISPPMEATNSVFKTLGFTIPSTDYAIPAATKGILTPSAGVVAGLVALWKKYMSTMLAVVLTSGITALIYSLSGSSNNIQPSATAQNSVPIITTIANNIPTVTNVSVEPSAKQSKHIAKTSKAPADKEITSNYTKQSTAVADDNNQNTITNITALDNENVSSDSPMLRLEPASIITTENLMLNVPVQLSQLNPMVSYYRNFEFSTRKGDNSIQIRRLGTSSVSNINLPSNSNTILANWSLAFIHKFNNNLSAGVEIGSEQFAQQFNWIQSGEKMINRQNPLLLWYGVSVRYSQELDGLGDISKVVTPYAQLLAGGTSSGFILRPQLGLVLHPYGIYNLTIGYEAAYLLYNVQNNLFNTNKYGLTIGAGINF